MRQDAAFWPLLPSPCPLPSHIFPSNTESQNYLKVISPSAQENPGGARFSSDQINFTTVKQNPTCSVDGIHVFKEKKNVSLSPEAAEEGHRKLRKDSLPSPLLSSLPSSSTLPPLLPPLSPISGS